MNRTLYQDSHPETYTGWKVTKEQLRDVIVRDDNEKIVKEIVQGIDIPKKIMRR